MARPGIPPNRSGLAATELAILLPFIGLMFMVAVDFCRVYFVTQTLQNSAQTAALFASGTAKSSALVSVESTAKQCAVADAASLDPPLKAENVTVTFDAQSVTVTLQYEFPMFTTIYAESGKVVLQRKATVAIAPAAGKLNVMRCFTRKHSRRAAVAVEAALVYPVMIFLFLGLIIGGVGVFRYQQVACLSREAARWASVRGEDYQRTTDLPFPTQQQIYDQAVLPMAGGMDPSMITVQVEWVDQGTGTAYAWDTASKSVLSINSSGEYVTTTVRVTVTYQWTPNLLGIGTRYMRSVCEIPMSY